MPAPATNNPYERRRRERPRSDGLSHLARADAMFASGAGAVSRPQALEMEDLNAMAFSARMRGEMTATARLEDAHETHLLAARREAWNQGHEAGVEDGRARLLTAIDEQHGEQVRKTHGNGLQVLKRMEDPRKVTKAELERALDAAVDVLAELIHQHHEGFAPEVPF